MKTLYATACVVAALLTAVALSSCTQTPSPAPAPSSTLTATRTEVSTATQTSTCACQYNAVTNETVSCVCPGDQVKWPYASEVRDAITSTMIAKGPGKDLCPKYDTLSLPWKLEAWVAVLGGIAWTESEWKLAPKPFREPNQDIDPVTKLPTYSEGLYQLSYKDHIHTYYRDKKGCKDIDYAMKNITNKQINIDCAMSIITVRLDRGGGIRDYFGSARPERKDSWAKTTGKIRQLYSGCGV